MSDPKAHLQARFDELRAKWNEIEAAVGPIQVELDEANLAAEAAHNKAAALAQRRQDIRGGADYLSLCKEIALLAKALSG